MNRSAWCLPILAFAVSLVAAAPTVGAQAFSPIFTKQYTRASGRPASVADAFSACDRQGTFRVVVVNGPDGRERASSGLIAVNGVEVVRPRDFNQNVARIERPLTGILSDNRLEVELHSSPSATVQVTIEGVQACGARITSPTPGSRLTEPVVLVRGTVPTPPGRSVGVTVNGLPALVEAGQFATLVPVSPELTALTARGVDLSGDIGSDTVPVTVELATSESRFRLNASPSGGAAPLTVGFSLSPLGPGATVALDFDGDGVVDFQGATLDRSTFSYTRPGIYSPSAQITDTQGQISTATTLVQVSDPAALDVRLQAVWQGLKDALRAGDLALAGTFIHSDARSGFADLVNRFSATSLATIDQEMTTIQLVEVGPGGAQYEMLRPRDGQLMSFAVWFQLDHDGLWRIRRF